MKPFRNEHQRVVPQSMTQAWQLLATVGSADDRVWPAGRWPAMVLDDGLRPGSRGGHGPIRYRVATVDPGRAVRFDLEPGLTGWHEFRIDPVGETRVRWTHTLVITDPNPLVVAAIEPLHDALIEDLLDQVNALADQVPLVRRRLRRGVRVRRAGIAALTEVPPVDDPRSRRRRLGIAGATAGVLVVIGGLHAAWGLGASWPARDAGALARQVVGSDRVPPPAACFAVSVALGAAGWLTLARASADDRARRLGHLGTAGVAAVLGVRGVGGLVTSGLLRSGHSEYRRRDIALYSPLCLALAAALIRVRR